MKNNELEAVERQRRSYISHLVEWAQAQLDDWRLVPHLSLQADGRSGYNSTYSRAYRDGLWALDSSIGRYGGYSAYVDLDTGNIVNPSKLPKLVQAYDDDIIRIKPEELNARQLVRDLEEAGQEPTWKGYNADEQVRWRTEVIQEEDLHERYFRTKAPPTPVFELD